MFVFSTQNLYKTKEAAPVTYLHELLDGVIGLSGEINSVKYCQFYYDQTNLNQLIIQWFLSNRNTETI